MDDEVIYPSADWQFTLSWCEYAVMTVCNALLSTSVRFIDTLNFMNIPSYFRLESVIALFIAGAYCEGEA